MSELQPHAEQAKEKDSLNQQPNYPQGAKKPKMIKK